MIADDLTLADYYVAKILRVDPTTYCHSGDLLGIPWRVQSMQQTVLEGPFQSSSLSIIMSVPK